MKKYFTVKIFSAFIVFVLNAICHILVITGDIESTNLKIIGSYISIAVVVIAAWRFPFKFYLSSLVFVFLASSLGSCLNLYWRVGFYDIFIHFLSGIILAWAGLIVILKLSDKYNFSDFFAIKNIYAFLFSCSCAGFWEIYEFTVDSIINAHMQGDNFNTMGDMVAGYLGALTFLVVSVILKRLKKISQISK